MDAEGPPWPFFTTFPKIPKSKGSMADAINFAEPHLTRTFYCWVCLFWALIHISYILLCHSEWLLYFAHKAWQKCIYWVRDWSITVVAANHTFQIWSVHPTAPSYVHPNCPPPMCIQFAFGQTSAIVVGAQRCIYAPLPGPICQGFVVDEITERVGRSDKSKFWIGS